MIWGLYYAAVPVPEKCSTSPTLPTISARNTAAGPSRREIYGKHGGKWIDIPVVLPAADELPHASMEKAGFKEFPKDLDGFLG